jgi:hypothetical protein
MSETTQVHELSMANMASATRLMRLNNPGGVRISPCNWSGKITPHGARVYEHFASYANGIGAMLELLVRYYHADTPANTIEKLVYRYGDTHTDITSYINAVCIGSGIRARQVFQWRRETMYLITTEMCRFENKGRNPIIHPDLFAYVWLNI